MTKRLIILLFGGLCFLGSLTSQGQTKISLDQVHQLVLENSFAVKSAHLTKELAEENFKFYKSQLKPTIGLSARIPNYIKTSVPITQQDGTIAFQSIRQSNASLSANATKVLQKTGGTLFASSDIQRFDDFSFNIKQYNGVPIRIGINQPLFGFNTWKYQKTIQRKLMEEAKLNYDVMIEEALGTATDLYFNILISNQNLNIAQTNEVVNQKLLRITEERLLLGKVSKDEKLQLEIELNNAKLSVSQAQLGKNRAIANLYTFLGMLAPNSEVTFEIPTQSVKTEINTEDLLNAYLKNRPEILQYQIQLEENKSDYAQTKANFGFQANLLASVGLARGSDLISEIYTDPFDEQQINLSVQIPILDWGKKKAALAQIKVQQKNLNQQFEQLELEIRNSIIQFVLVNQSLQNEILLLKEIMKKAEERFDISNERYVLGNLDITNLTLAQREKDQSKRNYINSLKTFWTSYYQLRALSGFDIHTNSEINYQ